MGGDPRESAQLSALRIDPKPLPQHAHMHTQHFACSGDTLGCARQQHRSAHKGGGGVPSAAVEAYRDKSWQGIGLACA
jgi:hypothetical protein